MPKENQFDLQNIMKVGNNISFIRQKEKLTQEDLAKKCGMPSAAISRIEAGKIDISILTLLKIAEALEVNPKDLL